MQTRERSKGVFKVTLSGKSFQNIYSALKFAACAAVVVFFVFIFIALVFLYSSVDSKGETQQMLGKFPIIYTSVSV